MVFIYSLEDGASLHVDLVDEVEAPVMVGTPSNAGMLAKTAE